MNEDCIFKKQYGLDCSGDAKCIENIDASSIKSIISASAYHGDDLASKLTEQFERDPNLKIKYHKRCVSRYKLLETYRKRRAETTAISYEGDTKKRLRHSSEIFDFQTHCLYCLEDCDIVKDKKHPSRWRPASLVKTTFRGQTRQQPYNEYLLQKCEERNDSWADDVKGRILGAVSDLCAVKARYHRDCMRKFVLFRECNLYSGNQHISSDCTDTAFDTIICILSNDKRIVWNSVDLFREYKNHGGTILSRRCLISEIERYFSGDILVLSPPGVPNIVAFKSYAAEKLNLVKDEDQENMPHAIEIISKQIKKECKVLVRDRTCYRTKINKDEIREAASETLCLLMRALSPKLEDTLPSLLISNIVTSQIINTTTDLQIYLGILLQDQKELISHFHDYKVTCTYDEIKHFRKSAAVAAKDEFTQQSTTNNTSGLIQIVVDNFDTPIASMNGKSSTHSLAMIIMQPFNEETESETTYSFRRLKRSDMSQHIENDTELLVHIGDRKPHMPHLSVELPSSQNDGLELASRSRAKENDFAFFQDISKSENCPEFNGYNTKICREQGHTMCQKTHVQYLPLIDVPPADPSTILTALVKAQTLMADKGQQYVVFTCDQQLYRIALQVIWNHPDRFNNIIIRLGGMHLLMSFCGCIGSLMSGSGIEEVLGAAFGGVLKMLTGKKYPQNVRALTMLVEELLRPVFETYDLTSMTELQTKLDDIAKQSRTSKLWVDCVIKPVLVMLRYIRAERESDWLLHLSSVEEMLPYFFAASHFNYARYALYYVQEMQRLPKVVLDKFLKGEHTMHHRPGIFNGIWSDMAIESTYMRYGKSKNGIVGITLNQQALKTWAYSRHACSQVISQLNELRDKNPQNTQLTHKEESPARIEHDKVDRRNLREKLALCIDPLKPENIIDGLVNIATGKVICHHAINVDGALEHGNTALQNFKEKLPTGFYDTITKTVHTMSSSKMHITIGDKKIVNTELIYARAMALKDSERKIDTDLLLGYELSPIPTSLFSDDGQMRQATKSNLKRHLQVESNSSQSIQSVDAILLDGCAVLWVVPWPQGTATVQDYIDRFRDHINGFLEKADVYLVFDRYIESSTKQHIRQTRGKAASRRYSLRANSLLPAKNIILTVATNKAQLIKLIIQDFEKELNESRPNTLVITGEHPVPIEIRNGKINKRIDMTTTQEEADTIIIQQLARLSVETALVIADDTDIFLLLVHFMFNNAIKSKVFMSSPSKGKAIIDIEATVDRNRNVIRNLLAAHALTGCDTVASLFGIGKLTALKILRSGNHDLDLLGRSSDKSSFPLVQKQATQFILACYGKSKCTSLTDARRHVWSEKVSKARASAPAIASLPPTDEAFKQNVLRAHFQLSVWLNALQRDPLPLQPTDYGWTKNTCDDLEPTHVANEVQMVPEELLKLIKCSCKSQQPCRTNRCSCMNANMTCTVFCACNENCQNKSASNLDADDDDDDDDSDV